MMIAYFGSTFNSPDAVAKDLIIPQRITPLVAATGGVAFDGVNSVVFHLFHDAHLIGISILSIFIIPVERDNHTGLGSKLLPIHWPRSLNH